MIRFSSINQSEFAVFVVTRTSFKMYTFTKPSAILRRCGETLKHWLRFLQVWPVYMTQFSRDCDNCEATYRHRFPTWFHASRYIEEAYADAEGLTVFYEVSRKEYEEFESEFRDRNLEAFENGNGTRVII